MLALSVALSSPSFEVLPVVAAVESATMALMEALASPLDPDPDASPPSPPGDWFVERMSDIETSPSPMLREPVAVELALVLALFLALGEALGALGVLLRGDSGLALALPFPRAMFVLTRS